MFSWYQLLLQQLPSYVTPRNTPLQRIVPEFRAHLNTITLAIRASPVAVNATLPTEQVLTSILYNGLAGWIKKELKNLLKQQIPTAQVPTIQTITQLDDLDHKLKIIELLQLQEREMDINDISSPMNRRYCDPTFDGLDNNNNNNDPLQSQMNYLSRNNNYRGRDRGRGRYRDRGGGYQGGYQGRPPRAQSYGAPFTPPYSRGRGRDRSRGRGTSRFNNNRKDDFSNNRSTPSRPCPAIFSARCYSCNLYGHSRKFCQFIHKYFPDKAIEYNKQGSNNNNNTGKAQMNVNQATQQPNAPLTPNANSNNSNHSNEGTSTVTSIAPPIRASSAPYRPPTMQDYFPDPQ
jgi:hypothetical protein